MEVGIHLLALYKQIATYFVVFQGACILHMLREFLTPDHFKSGIVQYLKQHSYQNTVNTHLWESLTTVSACLGSFITL